MHRSQRKQIHCIKGRKSEAPVRKAFWPGDCQQSSLFFSSFEFSEMRNAEIYSLRDARAVCGWLREVIVFS